LLETLRVGLSTADQALLEERQSDASEKVRALVAALLALLPDSALANRMRERADAMLRAHKTGLLLKKQTLVCSPPEEIDKSWERDGIAKKSPAGIGLKAFWIQRVLAHVPPSHWTTRLVGTPAELLQRIVDDPFAENVVNGWTDAAIHFADSDNASGAWLAALAAHWLFSQRQKGDKDRDPVDDRVRALIAAMSPVDAEQAMIRFFEQGPNVLRTEAADLLQALRRPWSIDFSDKIFTKVQNGLRSVVQKENRGQIHQWVALATITASAVVPELLSAADEALRVPDSEGDITAMVNRLLQETRLTIGRRKLFYETLRPACRPTT
jgi:hypothetical protein